MRERGAVTLHDALGAAVSVDIPRAWEIAKATPNGEHHPDCAYRWTVGVLLCDCHVLTAHPEYTGSVVHTRGGVACTVE